MRDVELWEAVALSLNLEPDKLPVYLGAFERFGDDLFRICPQTFLDRLQVANSNCGISLGFKPVHKLKARCLVDLPAFGAWTVKLNIPNIPPAFAAMAETATTVPVVMPAQTAATPAPVEAVGASGDVQPDKAGPGWNLKTSIDRAPGYRWPLYQFLKAAHIAGQPIPKAREVLDAWALKPPPNVQVMSDGIKYDNGLGKTKEANLRAMQQAIKGLLK